MFLASTVWATFMIVIIHNYYIKVQKLRLINEQAKKTKKVKKLKK